MGRENIDKLIQGVSDNRIRRIFQLLDQQADALERTVNVFVSGGGGSVTTAAGTIYTWVANGPYVVDTLVDGARIVGRTEMIVAVWLHRTTAGTSGSTILDVNRSGSTIYTTTANRPTIDYSDADSKVLCAAPDSANLAMGDVLTVDTDQIEDGEPESWSLSVVAEAV